MSELYTRDEIDSIVADWSSRVGTAEGTLQSANTNISTHVNAQDAHSNILENKANVSTVNDLTDVVDALDARLRRYELDHPISLEGTTTYNIQGTIFSNPVNIQFDIQPIDQDNPVVYQTYENSGELLDGLEFQSGSITGTPTVAGEKTFSVLARSGDLTTFISVHQNYTNPYNSPGYEELLGIVEKLRAGDIESIQIGTTITIPFVAWIPHLTDSRIELTVKISGSDKTLIFGGYNAEKGMYEWYQKNASGNKYYMEDYIVPESGKTVYDTLGRTVGSISRNQATWMCNLEVRLEDIEPLAYRPYTPSFKRIYAARFRFVHAVDEYSFDRMNNLGDTSEFGFTRRFPKDIRQLLLPVYHFLPYNSADSVIPSHEITPIFIPSQAEEGVIGRRDIMDPTKYVSYMVRTNSNQLWVRQLKQSYGSTNTYEDALQNYSSTTMDDEWGDGIFKIAPCFTIG